MQFRRAIGGEGAAPGRFKKPRGVAISRGRLVVSESAGRVQVLSLQGLPLQVLSLDSTLTGLSAREGRVWVADRDGHKVHVFEAV